MLQVVQAVSGGPVRLVEVPRPTIGPTEVLVQTRASVVSPGTERAVTQLAQSSLLAKARARPDLVRNVVNKARTEGVSSAARAVRTRLGDDVALGYSAAGIALEVGEAVADVLPGQLVATGGANKATHAEFQAVPALLCVPVPDGVAAEDAAFATVASVALHGLRLADVGAGAKVAVVGLGLVGQLAVRLALAAGCDVAGIDVSDFAVSRARDAGAFALVDAGEETTKALLEWSRGRGVDAVLLTAATPASTVIMRSTELCRDRATLVVVGDVGLDLDRRPFYDRELTLRFARSYGPGRYERSYEDWGVDYPAGMVRWTEGRNLEAVLDLMASGKLATSDLITHRFPLADAPSAYRLIEEANEPVLGVQFEYTEEASPERPITVGPARKGGGLGVGLIGAGAFASTVLVPALDAAGFDQLVAVASASGLSARRLAERVGFERAVSGAEAVIDDPAVDVVVIATPHDTHAGLAAAALRAGKHVFCEKPLALSSDELAEIEDALRASNAILFVDFNRRWSEAVRLVVDHLGGGSGPLVVTYRVNAAPVEPSHWYNDRRQGGRLLGEVCHFVDTCAAIIGAEASQVQALSSGRGENLLGQDLVLAVRYRDGSLASITYSVSDSTAMGKERIEVFGRGRSAAILDFAEVVLDGRSVSLRRQDKGHRAAMVEFRRRLQAGTRDVSAIGSTRTTLFAAAQLGGAAS